MPMLRGSCHGGRLRVASETALSPEALPVRACQCSFCLRHATLSTSDPTGHVTFEIDEPALTSRYQFGLRMAEFLICARCGVNVGAIMRDGDATFAVLNIRALDDRARFVQPPQPMDYDGEDAATRATRRRARWTPATVRG